MSKELSYTVIENTPFILHLSKSPYTVSSTSCEPKNLKRVNYEQKNIESTITDDYAVYDNTVPIQ